MSNFCVNVCRFNLGKICGGETNKQAEVDCVSECNDYAIKHKLTSYSGKIIADLLATINGCSRYVLNPKKKLPAKQAQK